MSLTTGTSFTLSCSGGGGTAAATANVTIAQAAAPPAVTLTANPDRVASGSATTLMFSATDATSCAASGGWSGSRDTSGSQQQAPITLASAYTLTCTGPGGTAGATANVVIAARPVVSIGATPSVVASGGSVTLNWSTLDATSCVASGGWSGPRGTSGTQPQTPITTATVYTLTCTGPGGMGAGSVNVAIAPPPTVTITATPTSVVSGGATTLTWSSMNANSCVASGSWSGPRGTSGSEMITNITAASAFTLTCNGPGGTGAATANVIITPAMVSITANPLTVSSGGSTTLMWSTTNATACTASGSWTGSKPTSGNEVRTGLTANASFTLTCTGPGGTGADTVNVSIAQAGGSYSTNFDLTENPISENGVWRRNTTAGFTNVRTSGGTAFGTNGVTNTFDDSYALLRGFGPNYTAQAVVQRSPALNTAVTHEVQLLMRFTDDGTTARGYECLFSFAGGSGGIQIIRWDGLNLGSMNFQELALEVDNRSNIGQIQTGTVVKASVAGDVISVFVNNTLVARARDSRYPTGQPGIGFFIRPNGNSANFAMTSYSVTSN